MRAMLGTKWRWEILKTPPLAGNFARSILHPNCWPGSIARSEVTDVRTHLLKFRLALSSTFAATKTLRFRRIPCRHG